MLAVLSARSSRNKAYTGKFRVVDATTTRAHPGLSPKTFSTFFVSAAPCFIARVLQDNSAYLRPLLHAASAII
jgi:hypothetical protein